jgi:homoserine O-acetyltransferase
VAAALGRVTAKSLVLGIDSDRLFPVNHQELIARLLPSTIDGGNAVIISSPFGHDGFLIEHDTVGTHLARLLTA